LRTQQIVANETGIANTIDPVAGSYAIETLTNQIEERAQEYLAKIDAIGGMVKAIEAGFVQSEIQRAAYDFQLAVEKKEKMVVGVNDFIAEDRRTIPTHRVDAEIERRQVRHLEALRAKRDSTKTRSALADLDRRARNTENLVSAILAAVEAYATVGEISDTLRGVYGEYHESVVL
jgi:methylmalonyl-CoA mutase N-terminal domain/subunit